MRSPVVKGWGFGKVILLGEHAVVYGHPALCAALQDGVAVEAVPGSGRLCVPAWDLAAAPCFDDAPELLPVARAYGAILRALSLAEPPAHHNLVATFSIPTGAGLGSSAALSVALTRALDQLLGLSLRPEQIAHAALCAEQVFHGRPSGLDHTVAQLGGFGLFRRGAGLSPLSAEPVPLLIGMTGRPRDTRGRVARVAELYMTQEQTTRGCFAEIAGLVESGARAVRRGDLEALGQAMDQNQEVLGQLEVSCPEIEHMCRLARKAGALGAKLTGGGGGGCVIALAPGREEAVRRAWQEAGFSSFFTTIGGSAAAEAA
jgi:mevalonate kinase